MHQIEKLKKSNIVFKCSNLKMFPIQLFLLQVNKMQFEEKIDGDSESRMFRVKSTCPKGPAIQFICQAENTKSRNLWTGTMSKQLQTQKEFLQALQAPIAYHNKRMKEL